MRCATKDCPHNARHAVHGGVLVLLLCTPCWREALARLVDAVGITVRPVRGWAT